MSDMSSTHAMKIPDKEIREKYSTAMDIIESSTYSQQPSDDTTTSKQRLFHPISPNVNVTSQSSLKNKEKHDFQSCLKISDEDPILPPRRHAIIYDLRRSIASGLIISQYFIEPLGFLELGEKNNKSILSSTDKERFQSLIRTKTVVALFSSVSHFLKSLGHNIKNETNEIDAFPYESTKDAFGWFLGKLSLSSKGIVNDDDLIETLASVCSDVLFRIENDSHRLMSNYYDEFSKVSYSIEEDDFRIHGFSPQSSVKTKSSPSISIKKPEEVIGNHIAKSQAMKLAKMISCHDFEKGRNPFVDTGGFIFTSIGDGQPGTGKTTLIQMVVGLIKEYTEIFGYPFHYENFGVDQISEYQGKSGQNCRSFINRVIDTKSIGFGTIDDIDQVAGSRDDRNSSSGQQEVTAVLMDAFAGAYTNVIGNASFFMASNYPEKVDGALRQRAAMRWLIDGPQTKNDYIDILYLLLGKTSIPNGDHDFFSDQAIKKIIQETYKSHGKPKEDNLLQIWDDFTKQYGHPKNITDIGTYLFMIKEKDPRFTGRSIKNITDSIKTRSMDIDLPDEWFSNPEIFVKKPYDEKVSILNSLRLPITIEMVLQEINRYADSEFRYADKSDQAEINNILRRMENTREAELKFHAMNHTQR